MRILVSYRGAPRIRGWETGAMVARAFRRLGHTVLEYGNIYESNEKIPGEPDWTEGHSAISVDEFDLHVFMECNDPEPQYTGLKNVKADKRVGWFFDTSYYPGQIQALVQAMEFDWVFSANPMFDVNFFKRPTSVLAYAADVENHFMPVCNQHTRNFSLVGSDRPERRKIINLLDRAVGGAHLISGVFKEEFVDALADSAVVINENPPQGRGLLNMRTFEAPAAGALLMAQNADYITDYFVPGMDMLVYDSMPDLLAKCQHLMDDPDYLHRLREAGQRRVADYHTYDHRVQEMLDVLGY
jgi:hypothetical protein